MIFVTVGTHEQQSNRLIAYVDRLKEAGVIQEEVVIQTGFSTYEPQHCKWSKTFSYQQMLDYVSEARIVVTHGGPSSFFMPLVLGKIPIVVPRTQKFHEHVNDHQVHFCRQLKERGAHIFVAETCREIKHYIRDYDEIVNSMSGGFLSHNEAFSAPVTIVLADLIACVLFIS